MKKLTLIFTLLVSTLMFSSASYAEWRGGAAGPNGHKFYVDFERIRKHDGYVYYWHLIDFLKPQNGFLSIKVYSQGDCKLFRLKILSVSLHKEPMGGGTSEVENKPVKEWRYPSPDTPNEVMLKAVCDHVK